MAVRAALASIVGDEHVHDPADWLEDITEHPAGCAEAAVSPGSRDEVIAIVQWAAAQEVAVTPVVAGYNVAGIALPQGGIVLDLRRLTGLEIDPDIRTAIVEPGVTFAQLKSHLDEHHPDLAYTYPFAPPFTSVLMNALLDGLNNLSLPGGAMGRWLTGVEAGLAVLENHGFPPFLVARPMEGGRYYVLRFVACFDRGDAEELGRVRSAMGELADVVLDHGYVPYKASADAARRILDRADPGWTALWTRMRDALDPDRRMNPGRWPGT